MAAEDWGLFWTFLGAVLIASTLYNFAVSLQLAPLSTGWIGSLLLLFLVGVALVFYGSRMYRRARRAKAR